MMLLVDGNNMSYRALYAVSLSHNRKDTSILFGVIKMLSSIVKLKGPTSVLVAFDSGSCIFRKRLLPQYKENRTENEKIDWDAAYEQMDELCNVTLPMHGIMTVSQHGCEADDLMAQAARIAQDDVVIVSTDADLLQCVTETVHVYNPYKLMTFTLENVPYEPADQILFKVLAGDSSDNIPGVPSIGPRTAEKIIAYLHEHEIYDYSFQTFLSRVDDMPFNVRQRKVIQEFTESQWNALWDVIDLYYDRCGARLAVLSAPWRPLDEQRVKRYYFDHGFVSLIEDNNALVFKDLQEPQFDRSGRTPGPFIERRLGSE